MQLHSIHKVMSISISNQALININTFASININSAFISSFVTAGLLVSLDASNLTSYPGSGSSWNDLSGNGNTTTLVNNPTFSTDVGGSIIFDGSNDYANVPVPTVNSFNTITVSGWIKWLSLGNDMFLGMSTYDVWTQSNTLGFNNGASNVIGINAATVSSLGLLGNWKYYTFIMNKTGLLSTNKIYINGTSTGPLTAVVANDGNIPGFNTNIRLASWNNGGFNGNLQYANLQVYNRELTAQEVMQNYLAMKSKFGL